MYCNIVLALTAIDNKFEYFRSIDRVCKTVVSYKELLLTKSLVVGLGRNGVCLIKF